jgi:hypothetical protein
LKIRRGLKHTRESDFLSLVNFISSIPNSLLYRVEAFAVLPGMGEDWRLIQAIQKWQSNNYATTHFFIAGFNQSEKTTTATDLRILSLPPFNLRINDPVYSQLEAGNTKEQAEWVLSMAKECDVRSLAIFAPSYHMPRAYLTFLKTFLKNNFRIVLVPAPVFIPPDRIIPESEIDSWEMFPGEIRRIRAYQEKGDVATLGELKEYFAWMWKQPLFRLSF